MSVQEIFSLEKRDKDSLFDIHFYMEGSFWRAYEWSAYLSRMFPSELNDEDRLKVLKKVTKDCENGYVQVGLQLSSFEKYFPSVVDNEEIFEMKNKHIIIHAKQFFVDKDFSEYEDKEGQADVPIAIMPRTGEITLLQSDGDLTEEEFQKAIDLAMEGCLKVSELQKEALMKKYSTE